MIDDRILLHLPDGSRAPVDPWEIAYVETDRGDSVVHLEDREPLREVRELGEVEALLEGHGFLRIHRNTLVNLRQIGAIRRAERGSGWEVVLETVDERVLPVSRRRAGELFDAFGEQRSGASSEPSP